MTLYGYGRYADDPSHIGCPRAKSDMTPCIARDGAICLADPPACVGCGAKPGPLLKQVDEEAMNEINQQIRGAAIPRAYADRLRARVRELTEPEG